MVEKYCIVHFCTDLIWEETIFKFDYYISTSTLLLVHNTFTTYTINFYMLLNTISNIWPLITSVRWHKLSYFRSTTTLRDTQNHPFLKIFLWVLKKFQSSWKFYNWNLSVSQNIGRNNLKIGFLSIITNKFWVVVWVRVPIETLKK